MIILKIGGGRDINLEGISRDLSNISEKVIIVHGANYFRDMILGRLGKGKKIVTSVSGYTSIYSDDELIDVQMMIYAGLRNKRIVETLQKYGVNAIGLCGLDGGLVRGERNKGIRVGKNGRQFVLRDSSGKPKKLNKELIDLLLSNCYVPVLSIPILDEDNNAINSENDDLVSLIQRTFNAEKVIQLIEAPGFLEIEGDYGSLVKHITKEELEDKERNVKGRMKRKILSLKKLFERGGGKVIVYVSDGRVDSPVKYALEGRGTIIK